VIARSWSRQASSSACRRRGQRIARRGPRYARVGGVAPSLVVRSLLDFHMDVTLDGDSLTAAEIRKLLVGPRGWR